MGIIVTTELVQVWVKITIVPILHQFYEMRVWDLNQLGGLNQVSLMHLLTNASNMWEIYPWFWKIWFSLKIKELINNNWIKENVRHRAFNCCLTQSPGILFLATRSILYPTTEKNHPVAVWILKGEKKSWKRVWWTR